MTVGLITHLDCAAHAMHPGHPERPERLTHLLQHLQTSGLAADMVRVDAQPATRESLSRVHPASHLDFLDHLSPTEGIAAVDPDTALCPQSLHAAQLAAGGVVQAMQSVVRGELDTAFCAVRPPGHHAEADIAMGFCLYNSVAVAARAALQITGINRVAIFDFDVHHGNGTVDIFKDQPEVLVCSSFQHPYYPNRYFDIDRPNIVNTPLPAGTGGAAFRKALEADWIPASERHKPDLVLVSAGFDAHRDDPLAGLNLLEEDFQWATELTLSIANEHAKGRLVSALEGGYDLDALASSVSAHIGALLSA